MAISALLFGPNKHLTLNSRLYFHWRYVSGIFSIGPRPDSPPFPAISVSLPSDFHLISSELIAAKPPPI